MGSEIRRNMCRVLFSTHTAFKRTYLRIHPRLFILSQKNSQFSG
jgi:hypothetical protein